MFEVFGFCGFLALSLVALLLSRELLPVRREFACGLPFVPIKRTAQLHGSVLLAILLHVALSGINP